MILKRILRPDLSVILDTNGGQKQNLAPAVFSPLSYFQEYLKKKIKLGKRNNTLINTKNNKDQHYPKSCVKHQVKLNRLAVLVMIIIS